MAVATTSYTKESCPRVTLTVTESSSTGNTATYSYTLSYVTNGYTMSSSSKKTVTASIGGESVYNSAITVNGKTTYTIATGTITKNKTHSSQTLSIKVSIDWGTAKWSGVVLGVRSGEASLSLSAATSYSVIYNANGGSGGPGSQTKWYGETLTLSSTKPTRIGYTFSKWNTESGGTGTSYTSGASYTSNSAVTLYAQWTANKYTITLNANGGYGGTSSITKTYNSNVTLPTIANSPTRTNYKFLGWATTSSAKSAQWTAGSTYSNNITSNTTLYAVWELAYIAPKITNLKCFRSDSSGIPNDEDTYACISFDWKVDRTIDTTNAMESLSIAINGTLKWSSTDGGSSGTVTQIFSDISTDLKCTVVVTLKDTYQNGKSVTKKGTIPVAKYIIDVRNGGNGIGFGKASETEGTAEFGFDAKFDGSVYGNVFGLNKLPEIPENSDLNDYIQTGCWAIYSNEVARTISNMPNTRAGRLEVSCSTGVGIDKIDKNVFGYLRQKFIPYSISSPTYERDMLRSSATDTWQYSNWIPTNLSSSLSNHLYRMYSSVVLWEGAWYMTSEHTITLSHAVSEQKSGIVLTFCKYSNGAAQDDNFNHFFVPKIFVNKMTGYGSAFTMMDINFGQICNKYLYINDTTITGHENNIATGTGASGITYANNKYVLRYVFGV